MDTLSLLAGLLPLIVFALVDSFSSLKTALITTVIFAFIETIFSLYYFGEIDWITGVSFVLIGLFSYFSYKKDDKVIFMWQPVVISWTFGAYILFTKFMGSDLFYDMMMKYQHLVPEKFQAQMNHPVMLEGLKNMSYTASVAFLLHGTFTLFAAYKMGKWWWLFARGVGFYVFLAAAVFSAQRMAFLDWANQ